MKDTLLKELETRHESAWVSKNIAKMFPTQESLINFCKENSLVYANYNGVYVFSKQD